MRRLIRLFQELKLSLRWKLLTGFLLVNAVLLVALALVFAVLIGSVGTIQNLQSSRIRVNQITSIKLDQNKLVNSALDYMWSKNLDRLDTYEASRVNLNKELAAYQPTPANQATYDDLKKEIGSTVETLDEMITFRDTSRSDQADNLWRTTGTQQIEHSTTLAETLNQTEEQFADAENTRITDQAQATIWLTGGLAVLALIIALGLALLLTEIFTQPIKVLEKRLNQVAEGDLTGQMHILNQDELGQLGHTYNTTVDSLQELIRQLLMQSQQVTVATEELTTQARSQVAGSSQQTSAIAQATATIEELSLTAQEIAKQSQRVVETVQHSLEQAQAVSQSADTMFIAQQQGRQTVANTIATIHKLKEQVDVIEIQQQVLVEQSTTIQAVINLISDIAKETHLLSLNAAIEAAGAGAYGTRFSGVARAIKELANRAVNGTVEVRLALEGIVQSVTQTTQSTEQVLKEAALAVEEAEHSDVALIKLTKLSEQVKEEAAQIEAYIRSSAVLAGEIGATTNQQRVASQQMFETMLQIRTVTEQNLSTIKQGEAATTQLGLSAYELKQRASAFVLTY
jgi:methyl-accepting chemotaxis protein